MKRIGFIVVSLFVAALAGCGSNAPKKQSLPNWVTSPPSQAGMAYGVGSAEIYTDRAEAMNRAVDSATVQLAKQLRVQVSGQLSSDVYERQQTGKQTEVVKEMRNQIRSKVAPVQFEDIKTEQTAVDPNGKVLYAMVSLDRTRAAATLRRKMNQVEGQIRDIASKPEQSDRLANLQQKLPALVHFTQYRDLADKFQMVSETKSPTELSQDLLSFERSIYDTMKQLVVVLQPQTQDATELTKGVAESLTKLGLRIDTLASNADITIAYDMKQSAKEQGGTHYVFAQGDIMVIDKNGRVLTTVNKEVKGVSSFADRAKSKAADQLADALGDAFTQTLAEQID